MKKIKKMATRLLRRIVDTAMGNGLMQEENIAQGEKRITKGMPSLLRQCGGEGIVLLKNEDKVLPLDGRKVAVFGRCQLDWFYVGYGSGGDVHPPYKVCLMEGLENAGVNYDKDLMEIYRLWCTENTVDHGWWGHWPYYYPEMPLEEDVVVKAAGGADTALVVIGRAAGEDRENILKPGSYYLTAEEERMLQLVCAAFPKVIVIMNCGSIVDLSFLEKYSVQALVYAWQLGQESGNAVADVLTGRVNPSGKLTDTIAFRYEDYPSSKNFGNREFNNYEEDIYVGYRYFDTFCPERVRYPFGFGLSYTMFAVEPLSHSRDAEGITVRVKVTNIGTAAGKEVVQLYCAPPEGKLPKAKKHLVAYEKTILLEAGQSQTLELQVSYLDCASFDNSGVTGFANAFVMEKGSYTLLLGTDSRNCSPCTEFCEEKTRCLEQCNPICMPPNAFPILPLNKPVFMKKEDLHRRILENLPSQILYTGDKGIKLMDVAEGKASLEAFLAQLTDKELADLTRGEGAMDSSLGYPGNAGAFGGITPALREKGIPPIITADGPSGLRLRTFTSLLPCGTAIACTWNRALIRQVFQKEGEEVRSFGVDVLLGPGMNIHRDPLCGRNFEYYSEDPFLCGHTAAAAVQGLQSSGVSACPKHFACNNQETNRNYHDSRVSHRALREIYLKCFAICVREGKPHNLMTSYNKLNGVWCHYNYDLVTTVLRGEWGFTGNVITDWWMRRAKMPEFPRIRDNAYRVRAQVDVLMPGNMDYIHHKYHRDRAQLRSLGKPGGLTRGELQRSAANVLGFAIKKLQAEKSFHKNYQNN